MTKRELYKSLENLCCEMRDSYSINSGGCCFVAAVIAEQLELNNISFQIACCYDPTHFWIKAGGKYINRDGYCKEELNSWNSEYLFNKYYSQNWNDYYNRRWNLIVKTRIRSLFLKYENSRS